MKKIILCLCLFLVYPIIVHAIDYDVTNLNIEAYIEDNGDVLVKEIIVLDGNFNGYERDLIYKVNLNDSYEASNIYSASDITDINIKGKYIKEFNDYLFVDTDYTPFEMVNSASSGDKGKYIFNNIDNGYRMRMYYKSNNQKVAFYLTYKLKDVVTIHSDTAEIYYPFVGDDFADTIKNVDIKVYLPNNDASTLHRVWAHGPITGEVEKINNNGLHAYATNLNEVMDIRMTFDKSLVPNATKMDLSTNFDKILEIENKRAEDVNKLRSELLLKYNFVKYGTIALYVILTILTIYIYFKYGKSPKSPYYSKYNREFIDDYNVEVIDYLMNKNITPNAMSASIMNLIYKKNISVEEITEAKKKTKNYLFTLLNTDNINDSEAILIEFLFDKIGKNTNSDNKKQFTTLELKKYADGVRTCDKFIASFTKWKNNIVEKGKQEHFYEKSSKPVIIGILLFIISFLMCLYALINEVDFIPTYILIVVSILFFVYSIIVDKKTEKGVLHYSKWTAFKNFLNDFGSFELKELPEIILWERYLVYATVFGLADKVQKNMNVKIKEFNLSDNYYPSYIYIGNNINVSINNALTTAYNRKAANYSNSHSSSSSGSGYGGGFSGSSGFSGGGGGRGF